VHSVLLCIWRRSQVNHPSRYVTSHPGELSLAIHLCIGAMSTSESWGINRHTVQCSSCDWRDPWSRSVNLCLLRAKETEISAALWVLPLFYVDIVCSVLSWKLFSRGICTANAAGDEFLPYFQHTVDTLKLYLINTQTEDQRKVQIQAVGKQTPFVSWLWL